MLNLSSFAQAEARSYCLGLWLGALGRLGALFRGLDDRVDLPLDEGTRRNVDYLWVIHDALERVHLDLNVMGESDWLLVLGLDRCLDAISLGRQGLDLCVGLGQLSLLAVQLGTQLG